MLKKWVLDCQTGLHFSTLEQSLYFTLSSWAQAVELALSWALVGFLRCSTPAQLCEKIGSRLIKLYILASIHMTCMHVHTCTCTVCMHVCTLWPQPGDGTPILQDIYNTSIAQFIHKLINNLLPDIFHNYFKSSSEIHYHNTRHSNTLFLERKRTEQGKCMITNQSPVTKNRERKNIYNIFLWMYNCFKCDM